MNPPIDLLDIAYRELNMANLAFRWQALYNHNGSMSELWDARWLVSEAERDVKTCYELILDLNINPQQTDI